ncbi:MAG: hypothetical protein KAR38_12830, partial [Calditrichia bacterium]|nr:hypothetical protein [Calditrichia bacterium]
MLFLISGMYAQNYEVETKLLAGDGAANDWFGYTVSISGNFAIVGSMGDSSYKGAAYIYKFNGSGWVQQQKLIANDGTAGDWFGYSVSISGNTAIVGTPYQNTSIGAAYIFEFNGSNWTQVQKMTASDGATNDEFGYSVSISRNRVIVGAEWDNDNGNNSGSAYIFEFDGSSWVQQQKLLANDGAQDDYFGTSVSINGDTAIVGAIFDDDNGSSSGSAYIFDFDGSTWTQQQKLTAGDGAAGDRFGGSVSISGNTVIVGAAGDDDNGSSSGSAYIYQFDGSSWMGEQKLIPSDGAIYDGFGTSVSICGNNIIVGALYDSGNELSSGSAYIFHFDGGSWDEYRIIASDGAEGDCFGRAVAVDGNMMIVGADEDDDNGFDSGSGYIYEFLAIPRVTVSNGKYNNRTKVSWTSESDRTERFLVYRNNEKIDSTVAGARAYYDYEAVSGKIYKYSVTAFSTDWGETISEDILGWKQTNGQLEGTVKTPYGAGVDNVEIDIYSDDVQLNSCLEFDGDDDYVINEEYKGFPSSALTFSFWMKSSDTANEGTPISFSTTESTNSFLLTNYNNFRIGINAQETGGIEISANDGQWHHIAITWENENGEVNLLKDGLLVFTGMLQQNYSIPEDGYLVLGQEQDILGGGFDTTQAFNGVLDEVRLWNKVRTPEEIQADMYRKLKGDENNLVSYWTFDDLPDRSPESIAGDYAINSGNHFKIHGPVYSVETNPAQNKIITDTYGSYALENIYYGESAQFELIPFKSGHGFDPAQKTVVMDMATPVFESVNFIDTTAITVSGSIRYAGTNCDMLNVEILLDDEPTGIFTNTSGEFNLTFSQPGYHNIKPSYGDSSFTHKFLPAEMNLNVEDNIFGLEFLDTTTHILSGKFGGPCNAIIGTAEIHITSYGNSAGCFDTTIATDASGNFSFPLPAQA